MRLDHFSLLQSVHALESALHTGLSRTIEIRRTLEAWPERGCHPLDLEAISAAIQHTAKAITLVQRLPLGRP
jgi:hypothetical protein